MRKIIPILFLLLFAGSMFADERVRSYPDIDSTDAPWYNNTADSTWSQVDSSGSRSVWFIPHNSNHLTKENTGYSTVTIWVDTLTSYSYDPGGSGIFVATLDTIDVLFTGLKWDFVDERYEEVSIPASGDTTQIKNNWRWNGGTYVSSKYQLSKVLNFRTAWDAIKITVSTNVATMPFRFRATLDVTEDR